MGAPSGATLLCALAGVVFASALGVAVWRMVARERHAPPPGHRRHAFPLPPRFGLALPGLLAWVLVVIVATTFALAGVGPGALAGTCVSAALAGPFAAFGWLHARRVREYRRALASGELDGWRETVLRVERSYRPGFWGTLVVAALVGLFIVMPLVVVAMASFGVGPREVGPGLAALAVVLPVPVAAGAWLVPRARSDAERRRELEGAATHDRS